MRRAVRPRAFPNRTRWLTALALVVASVELMSLLAGTLPGTFGAVVSATSVGGPSSAPAGSAGLNGPLEAAERSLAAGAGPADGDSVQCVGAGAGGSSAQCNSSAGAPTNPSHAPATLPDWTTTPPKVPAGRDGAALVYDGTDHYVLLFGGTGTTAMLGDTWKFAAGVWTQLHPAKSPAPRANAAVAFDAVDGYVVLFGGYLYNGSSVLVYGDTWTFSGGAWTQLFPSPAPPHLLAASMAYDAKDSRVVLFDGENSAGNNTAETWEFHAGAWTHLTPSPAPPRRDTGAMAYDALDGVVVLFGGYGGSGKGSVLGDTWTFSGGHWTKQTPAVSPPARFEATMAYSPIDGKLVMTGGSSNVTTFAGRSDTWTYGAGVWTKVGPAGHPSDRDDPSMADGTNTTGVVLFGGYTVTTGELNDTWSYQSSVWTHVLPQTPVARQMMGLTYDGADGYVLLFGGVSTVNGTPLGDTWKFSAGSWTPLHPPTSPSPRFGASMAYDASDGYVVLFGGVAKVGGKAFADTWSFAAGTWTRVLSSAGPPGRSDAGMTYDYADGEVVLFGGANATSGDLGDTWTYVAGVWSPAATGLAPHPSARDGPNMVYDSQDGYVVLFSGTITNGGLPADTWSFVAGNWTNLTFGLSVQPPGLVAAGFADDTYDGYLVLYGGDSGSGRVNTTWSFTAGVWTQLSPGTNPGTITASGCTYDPAHNAVMLFAGFPGGTRTWFY